MPNPRVRMARQLVDYLCVLPSRYSRGSSCLCSVPGMRRLPASLGVIWWQVVNGISR